MAQCLTSPAVSDKVKAALRTVSERKAAITKLIHETADLWQTRVAITDEQARLRANIQNVPKESAAFKRYLEKFDTQETELEKLQAAIDAKKAEEKRLQREFDAYLKGLNVE